MDDRNGSYLEGRRRVGLTAGSLISSPATVRNAASMQRRSRMAPQEYQVLRQVNESIVQEAPLPPSFTPVATAAQRRHQRVSMLGGDAEYSLLAELSDEDLELEPTRNLLEPKTPGGYTEHIQNTLQCLPEEDPGLAATSSLYTDFKHCMQRKESAADILDLLSSYEEVCNDHEILLRKVLGSRQDAWMNSVNLVEMIRDEKRTWRLISCLYSDRLKSDALEGSMIVDDTIEHESEKRAVSNLFKENSDIRQAQIVVDWLERNAADDLDDETVDKVQHYSENVFWENTLHYLSQRKRRGETGTGDKHIVSQMDPDAPSRQRKPLADLDQNDEVRLLKSMFCFIRAGKIEKAKELCMYCGQPWRVVSLDGWQLYSDPNKEAFTDEGPAEIEGNPLRDLWKLACWSVSQDEAIHTFERAVYGSLCGNLKSMVSVCKSWEDYLWAHYKSMTDTMVEHDLRNSPTLLSRVRPECAGGLVPLPETYWEQRVALSVPNKIFDRILTICNESARLQADFPFHLIQKFIILEDISGLVDMASSWVTESMEEESTSNIHPQLLRFLTHLFLFLRTIGVPMDDYKCETVIESYVRYLASEERSAHLVANYTAALGQEKQIDVYSDFLKTVDNKELRQEYLQMAQESGLDIPTITKTVVEDIRQQGDVDMTILGPRSTSVDISVTDDAFDPMIEPPLTRDDWKKIEALEWLVFDASQRAEAIKQCNALMRSFLVANKFTAAKEVMKKIPDGSVDVIYRQWHEKVPGSVPLPPEDDNAIREHLCLQAYLSAKQSFVDWFNHHHHGKPAPPSEQKIGRAKLSTKIVKEHEQERYQEELKKWDESCQNNCRVLRDKIYNVLLFPEGGWLIDVQHVEENESTRRRYYQMDVLRRTILPNLCNLLLTALKNTTDMKEECLHLADVIADEDFQVYKVFKKDDGRKILSRIQDIAVDLL